MGKPKDAAALERYRQVLVQLGHVAGYVHIKPLPQGWLMCELPGMTERVFVREMRHHVLDGGTIDQVEERRPEYVHWRFHYDIRMPVSGRRLYVESVLVDETDLEDCTIWVVNIHDA